MALFNVFFVVVAVTLLAQGDAASKNSQTSGFSGDATFTTMGLGACERVSQDTQLVAAINSDQFGRPARGRDGEWCGKCVRVTAPKFGKSVIVEIVDRAGRGGKGNLVLSKAAFKKLASLDEGRISITWTTVPC